MLQNVYSQKAEEVHSEPERGTDALGKRGETPGLRVRYKSTGEPVYYLNTTVDGYRLNEKAGSNLRAAKALLAKRTAQIYEGKYFPQRQNRGRLIREICAEYVERKLSHISSYSTRIHHFKPIDRLLGNTPVSKLRLSDVEDYQRDRLQERRIVHYKDNGEWKEKTTKTIKNSQGKYIEVPTDFITPSTVDHETNELMMALDWAVMERLIEYNPIKALKKLDTDPADKYMLDDGEESGPEWRKLYNTFPAWLKPIAETQYLTGMRIGEVILLKWDMINFPTKMITLPPGVTKTKKGRRIPMSHRLIELLMALPREHDIVHVGQKGMPLKSGNSIQKAFRRAAHQAGYPHITTHALRRTRGQIWDKIDHRISSEALGHDEKIHEKHYTEIKQDSLLKLVS